MTILGSNYDNLYLMLGRKISVERKRRKLTQKNLSEMINMSRSSVANIEKGRHYAPLHVLMEIERILGITLITIEYAQE